MNCHQLTSGERYMIAKLRMQRYSFAEVAELLGRDRSTI